MNAKGKKEEEEERVQQALEYVTQKEKNQNVLGTTVRAAAR